MAKKLTHRQKIFVEELIKNGGNKTAAARVAYNVSSDASAASLGLIAYKSVESVLEKDFEKLGLTREFLIKCLMEDIKKKKGNRTKEIDLAAKLGGLYDNKKTIERTENITFEALLDKVDVPEIIEGAEIGNNHAIAEKTRSNQEDL